eukprot:Blabericola_migrator_1__9007@NODE_479_length_8179_cov_106_519354_g373_i0_p4_GENE_NODE_479_length_8179_cov_106_519354_g373_i0NODE_479_length_8179_cov_106_519354_g373_i0_p4_ORF_typecomplete_len183_score16_84BEX/PF04538_12/0_012DUF3438/PF11920_8/0_093ARL6IP6/PF15062_6/0_26_NODE_479_length_8179_cov_106_519354_g373_i065427090
MCRRVAVRDSQTFVYSGAASSSAGPSRLSTSFVQLAVTPEPEDKQENPSASPAVIEDSPSPPVSPPTPHESPRREMYHQSRHASQLFRIPSRLIKSLTEIREADMAGGSTRQTRLKLRKLITRHGQQGDPSTSSSFSSLGTERDLQSSGSILTLQGVEIRKKRTTLLQPGPDERVLMWQFSQ